MGKKNVVRTTKREPKIPATPKTEYETPEIRREYRGRASDLSYRLYYKTEIEFRAAMEVARKLDEKGLHRRATRVRLNID